MPGMNGFEFLDRFQADPANRGIPVVVWTVKDLTRAEHARLRIDAQAILLKGQGGIMALVDELKLVLRETSSEGKVRS